MTDPTIIIDSIVVVGCGEIRLPVSRPKDSKLILQLWLPAKLRGKRDNAKEIRNKTNPILSLRCDEYWRKQRNKNTN